MIIGAYNTEDWGILSSYKVYSPEVDKKMINIPGRSGSIDATIALLGYPTYRNRKIVITLGIKQNTKELVKSVVDDIYKKIHGQRLKAIFPDDSNYYYIGRWNVDDPERLSNRIWKVDLVCDAEPYAYKSLVTTKNIAPGTLTINSDMPTDIIVKATSIVKGSYEGNVFEFSVGEHKINYPKLLGSKMLTITQGTGTIEYQEGKI